nr:hypothetical protein [Tanacetum cinerariifolium]
MNYFESNPCYDSNYFGFDQTEPPQYSVNPSLNIQNEPNDHELFISKLIQQKLQNEYDQPFPAIAITFDLPTMEPKDSLRMGDENLDTIPETKSNEFIKSNVESLVPNPSESKDLSDNISKEIYSNPLFDEEIISIKIDPHHFNAESDLIESLLNHDSSIISSSSLKIDYLLDEFADELILLKSILPGIDKIDCDPKEKIRLIENLYDNSSPHPPKEFISKNSDTTIESFSPSPIPVEDGLENDDYDSEVDILILEELLINDSLSLPENESFHFDIPSSPRPPTRPPDDDEIKPNSRIMTVKVVDDIFELYVHMP